MVYCYATIANCIIWANAAPEGAQLMESRQLTYSCIQDWSGGRRANVAVHPKFVDPDGPDDDPYTYEHNDCRLAADSPCIDSGKNEDWMAGPLDLDGTPRIVKGTVEMEAYEYVAFAVIAITREPSGGIKLTRNSLPNGTYLISSCYDLVGNAWIEKAAVASLGSTTSWVDTTATGAIGFYRIERE